MVKVNEAFIWSAITAIVVIIVIFNFYSQTVPTAQASGDSLNATNRCEAVGCFYNGSMTPACQLNSSQESTGCNVNSTVPLAGLFGANGVVFIIVMAALLIIIFRSYLKKK